MKRARNIITGIVILAASLMQVMPAYAHPPASRGWYGDNWDRGRDRDWRRDRYEDSRAHWNRNRIYRDRYDARIEWRYDRYANCWRAYPRGGYGYGYPGYAYSYNYDPRYENRRDRHHRGSSAGTIALGVGVGLLALGALTAANRSHDRNIKEVRPYDDQPYEDQPYDSPDE